VAYKEEAKWNVMDCVSTESAVGVPGGRGTTADRRKERNKERKDTKKGKKQAEKCNKQSEI
jgi:hypothetical protein